METEGLNAIALELRRIADAKAPQQLLGFGPAPKGQVWLFCNRKHGGVWYVLNDQSQPVIIEQQALTGYIRSLEIKETVRRNEKLFKVHFTIEADQVYVLESSPKAHFSKGFLSAIALITPDSLRQPITIVPQASTENGEVLFCNIYQENQQVFAPYDDATDWKRVSKTATNNVKIANDEAPQ